MSLLYAREVQTSLDSEKAAADIEVGEVATRDVDGGVAPTDPATDSRVDAIVVNTNRGEHLADHEHDFSGPYRTYESGEGPVPLAVVEEGVQFYPETVKDGNSTDPAPAINRNEEVGVVDLGNGPVVVEAGYTDNAAVQYGNGGAGDYIALGRADTGPVTSKGERVWVRITHDL